MTNYAAACCCTSETCPCPFYARLFFGTGASAEVNVTGTQTCVFNSGTPGQFTATETRNTNINGQYSFSGSVALFKRQGLCWWDSASQIEDVPTVSFNQSGFEELIVNDDGNIFSTRAEITSGVEITNPRITGASIKQLQSSGGASACLIDPESEFCPGVGCVDAGDYYVQAVVSGAFDYEYERTLYSNGFPFQVVQVSGSIGFGITARGGIGTAAIPCQVGSASQLRISPPWQEFPTSFGVTSGPTLEQAVIQSNGCIDSYQNRANETYTAEDFVESDDPDCSKGFNRFAEFETQTQPLLFSFSEQPI